MGSCFVGMGSREPVGLVTVQILTKSNNCLDKYNIIYSLDKVRKLNIKI